MDADLQKNHFLQMPVVIVGVLLMDRSGRKPLLMVRNLLDILANRALQAPLNENLTEKSAEIAGFCCWNVLRLLPCWFLVLTKGIGSDKLY